MKLLSNKYFREHFNFTRAGKWLVAGTFIGVISGCAAIVFQLLLSIFRQLTFFHWMGLEPSPVGGEHPVVEFSQGQYFPLLVILIPTLGGLLSGWIVYTFAPEAEGHGTDEVIKSYHRKRGIIRPRVSIVKMISSVITIGSGGSGGREGPIAQIGAGFGSYLAVRLGLNTRNRRWFMAAGMGAGIGSIFHAPLAGALFATEVLYSDPELESSVLVPASVSSIVAYSVYSIVFGWEHILLEPANISFNNSLELLPYLLLAIILALAANVYVRVFYAINGFFKNLKIKNYIKPGIGGFATGCIGLLLITATGDKKFIVDVLGGGYGILQEVLINGIQNVSIWILLVIAVAKILTTSLSVGSGGSAGVFGPSMVIGGTLGAAVGHLINVIDPQILSNPISFTIVGMAGFFAAAANTPLSTIIMVSELTGNYDLLLPTTWVCTISYFVGKKWSIYKSQVPNANFSQAHFGEHGPDIIQTTTVADAYKRDRKLSVLTPTTEVNDILDIVERSRQRIFPVVDEQGKLIGGFNIDDITHFLHDPEPDIKTAGELMYDNIPVVSLDESLALANNQMNDHMMDEAVIIESRENRMVKGIISSSDIVLTYNRRLSDIKYGDDVEGNIDVDKKLLGSFSLKSILENDLKTVHPDDNLGTLVKCIIQSERNLFPVIDDQGKLQGIILLNDIRKIMFDTSKYDSVTVNHLMIKPPAVIQLNEKMNSIIQKFEKSKAWNLPVVNRKQEYVGIVSKSRIFSVYRNALIEHTELI